VSRMNVFSMCARSRKASVTVDDIAKRLIDSGLPPAPRELPVAGTLMVEPTAVFRDKAELDRFLHGRDGWRSAKRSADDENGDMPREQ